VGLNLNLVMIVYLVTPKNLKEKLTCYPLEVAREMVRQQKRQGNLEDITVFQKNPAARKAVKGFDWDKSEQGSKIWIEAIEQYNFVHILRWIAEHRKIDVFGGFDINEMPEPPTYTFPRVMWVWDTPENKSIAVVIGRLQDKWLAVEVEDYSLQALIKAFEHGICTLTLAAFKYAEDAVIIKKSEIAEKFGISASQIKIVE